MARTIRRVYIDHSGTRLVTQDEPEECAFLFKAYGAEVTPAELEQWKGKIEKYLEGYVPPKKKKKKPTANKMKQPKADKAKEGTEWQK